MNKEYTIYKLFQARCVCKNLNLRQVKNTQEKNSRRTDFIFNIKVLFSCEAATSVQIQGIHKYIVTIFITIGNAIWGENSVRKTKFLKIAF